MSTIGGPAGQPSADPLVPKDFDDWTLNIYGIFKRSGRQMLTVFLLWSIIPAFVSAELSAQISPMTANFDAGVTPGGQGPMTAHEQDAMWAALGGMALFLGLSFLGALALAYFIAAGWAAALRVAVTDAAGKPIGLGEAMAYGARRGLSLWGWYLIAGLCVLAGMLLCVLPGLYLAAVFALFAPVLVFEGGRPLARSFRLVHGDFRKMLGRISLSFAGAFVVGLVLYVFQSLLAGAGLGSIMQSHFGPVDVAVNAVFALISTVLTAVILVSGLLVTYAEAAAVNGGPASTSQLLQRSSV